MLRVSSSVFLVGLFCQLVQATIYVTSPLKATTCNGGQPCSVQWVDDGEEPLLTQIGACHVGLYNGQQVLVQQLAPVDVGATHSFVFTPDPHAGPISDTYYINFTSTHPVGTSTNTYSQFSTFFNLANMSGSFASPVPSDTSTLAVPSSIASGTPNAVQTTVTINAPGASSAAISVSPTPTPGSSDLPSKTLSLSLSDASAAPVSSVPATPSNSGSSSVPPTHTGPSLSLSTAPSVSVTPTHSLTTVVLSSSTPSVTPTLSSVGSSTLTVPASSGFSTTRSPSSGISIPALFPSTSPSPSVISAGIMTGTPSRFVLAVVFSATILFGGAASMF